MRRAPILLLAASTLAALTILSPVAAQRGGGRGNVNRGNVNSADVNRAQTNVHRTDINANRNTNVNVNRDVDVHGRGGYRYDSWGHPVAATAAVATTAFVVGTMVASLPTSGCNPVNVGGVGYQHCGSTYYQPVYEGTSVQYVVVNPP